MTIPFSLQQLAVGLPENHLRKNPRPSFGFKWLAEKN
jgi:hypothetical protein